MDRRGVLDVFVLRKSQWSPPANILFSYKIYQRDSSIKDAISNSELQAANIRNTERVSNVPITLCKLGNPSRAVQELSLFFAEHLTENRAVHRNNTRKKTFPESFLSTLEFQLPLPLFTLDLFSETMLITLSAGQCCHERSVIVICNESFVSGQPQHHPEHGQVGCQRTRQLWPPDIVTTEELPTHCRHSQLPQYLPSWLVSTIL